MPINKGKGGKNRKKVKKDAPVNKRELLFKEEGQEYGLVTKMLGNCNMDVECADGEKRIAHIRGSMRNKIRIKITDTVLLSFRDFQDNKSDVIHLYNTDEVRLLQSYGELPSKWGSESTDKTSIDITDDNDAVDVVFDIDEI